MSLKGSVIYGSTSTDTFNLEVNGATAIDLYAINMGGYLFLEGDHTPGITISLINSGFSCWTNDLFYNFPTVYNAAIANIDAVS